jgi:hypothetical protein
VAAAAPISKFVTSSFLRRPVLRDSNNETGLEAAANGRADWIITFNWSDFGPAMDQFGIAISSVGEIVKNCSRDDKNDRTLRSKRKHTAEQI